MNILQLLRHISVKHLRHQKARSLMALIGIALGVAAMVSIDIVNMSVLRSFEDNINRITGRAVLQVTDAESGFPEAMLDVVQKVPGVEYAVPVIETNGCLAWGDERAFAVLGVDVLQDGNIRDYSITDESSDIPDPLLFLARPDSILLTREMAAREHIAIDQQIKVQTVQGTRTFTVRGLLEPDGPAKALGGDIAVMDLYAAQLAFGKEGRIDRIDVSILRGESLDTMKERIQAALPEGYNIDTPAGRSRQMENLMGRFRKSMDMIGYLALFVGMYLIYNTVAISVVQRGREIGILRALGATRRQVSGLFLGETVVLSLAASLLGIGLGIILAKISITAVARTVSSMYGRSSITDLTIIPLHLAKDIAIGVAASVIAAFFPSRSSSRISPISAIRSTPYSSDALRRHRGLTIASLAFIGIAGAILLVYKTAAHASPLRSSSMTIAAMLSLLLGISLSTPLFLRRFISMFHRLFAGRLGAGGRLAGLNLEKNLTRNAVAVAAVFFSISLSVSSSSLLFSVQKGLMDYIDDVERSDVLITSGHPLASAGAQTIPMPLEMALEIEAIPGVDAADPFRKLFITISGRRVLLEAIDIPRWLKRNTVKVVKGMQGDVGTMMPGKDVISVSESVASRYGLKPGDHFTLPTPQGPVRFLVISVVVSFASDSGVIFIDYQTFRRIWQDHNADMFSVYVRPGNDVIDVRDAIRELYKDKRKMFVLDSREFRAEIKKLLDQSFEMNNAVNLLTLAIAGFGIIITLLASVFERTREIGILRSIGMKRGQVSGLVLIESALLGLAGGLLGTFAGVLTGWINLEGFFRLDFGDSISYQVHYLSICWALLLAVGLAVLAGLYPARRAAKTNITEALSYE
ncbi:MAG: FtsX-like permease family protein [Nitrospirota bacterium]|nr:FtsX-like permease family protein [Nitrospirota bacterium]